MLIFPLRRGKFPEEILASSPMGTVLNQFIPFGCCMLLWKKCWCSKSIGASLVYGDSLRIEMNRIIAYRRYRIYDFGWLCWGMIIMNVLQSDWLGFLKHQDVIHKRLENFATKQWINTCRIGRTLSILKQQFRKIHIISDDNNVEDRSFESINMYKTCGSGWFWHWMVLAYACAT